MRSKIMLHLIMPDQISGPNTAARLIHDSNLKNKYEFTYLTQNYHAGGRLNIKLIIQLKKQILAFKPDLVHISGLQSSGLHAVIAARLAGIQPILVAIRGSSSFSNEISLVKKLIFKYVLEPLTMYLSTKYYTVTHFQQRSYLNSYQRKSNKNLGCIHNAIDLNRFKKLLANRSINKTQKITVSYIGRITQDKGFSFFVEAIKLLKDDSINFLIVGDGDFLEQAKRMLKVEINQKCVRFVGKIKDPTNYYLQTDIFVLPSLHENLSNALLQACASGACVVATNVGGNPEVIENEYNGLLIQPNSSKQLASAIKRLANDRALIQKLVSNSNLALKKFNIDNLEHQLDDIYNKMLNNEAS